MQQLQNASDSLNCAANVLEAVLDVMLLVREQCAHSHEADRTNATLIQVRAMGVLRKRPGATLSALSQQLALTLSATSRLVEVLVGKGFIARDIPEGNRRTVSLRLTASGGKVLSRALTQAQRELAARLQGLDGAERARLSRYMRRLSQAIESSAQA